MPGSGAFAASSDAVRPHTEDGTFELLEHHAAKWLNQTHLDEVKRLPADIRVIDAIKAEGII